MPPTLTEQDVRHVARLARLTLNDDQVTQMTQQLTHVLDHIAMLNQLDVEGVEPMAHPLDMTNVLREDIEQPGMDVQAALMNAPERNEQFFKVPKVLGEGSGA